MIKFSRVWAMPSRHTFTIKPIKELLNRYVNLVVIPEDNKEEYQELWADPFAGWNSPADLTNDLNPSAPTIYHLDAKDFADKIADNSLDGILLDPPYSPRQISECYKGIGLKVGMKETQLARVVSEVKDAFNNKVKKGGLAISFGRDTTGFGKVRGWEIIEIMIVEHGQSHHSTLVTVERKL